MKTVKSGVDDRPRQAGDVLVLLRLLLDIPNLLGQLLEIVLVGRILLLQFCLSCEPGMP